jgi:methionyl-tRNA formyltransferase
VTPAAPWRVAIVTVVPEVAAGYIEAARALGHEPVVVVAARPFPDSPAQGTRALVDAAGDVDIVFPASRKRLAPLLAAFAVDLGLCTGYPWRVPAEALAVPALGIVNGHPSLLPKYRGPYPVAWAVRNGETEIGMTYHLMDEAFDTGPVLAQMPIPLGDAWGMDELVPAFRTGSQELLPVVFARLAAGERGEAQDGGEYYSAFEDAYFDADLSRSAADLHNQVRAWGFMPPIRQRGPILERAGTRVRLVRTSLTEVDGAERVDCADGPLWVLESEPVEFR